MFGRPYSNQRQRHYGENPYRRHRGGDPWASTRRTRRSRPRPYWRQQLLALCATLAAVGVWYGTSVSIWVTDLLLDQIPIEEDIELGIEAKRAFPFSTMYHPHWTPLLQSVGHDLVRTYHQIQRDQIGYHDATFSQCYDWDFAVVRADFINAFALPGGTIRVTNKLLETLPRLSRGEVAALLGHEMGHVLHRHSQARLLQRDLLRRVLEALLYEDHDGVRETFGQALGEILAKSAAWLGEQRFSRRDEYQADSTSWELLSASRAGEYNPRSLQSLLLKLHRLEDRHRDEPDDPLTRTIAEWSQTHPATKDRIRALETKWNGLPAKERRRLSKIAV